jgi:phosphate acyltransferase
MILGNMDNSQPNITNQPAIILALDAMGGDSAPGCIIDGAALALKLMPAGREMRFLIFGDKGAITPHLSKHQALLARCELVHTTEKVLADDKPSVALRQRRGSSMRMALDAVAAGKAHCVVSAGNTGALMVLARAALKTLPGIDRPAIATIIPTRKQPLVMLDLGANVACDSGNLCQFARIGAVFAQRVLGVALPKVALLNIGVEELKGREEIREAAQLLRTDKALPGEFIGYVEGDDIGAGTADVIVCDGFTGNIALKTMEGTAKLLTDFLREAVKASLLAKFGMIFALPAFRRLYQRVDPRKYNGAMFLGLRGICVKSHGGTDAVGFASALQVAYELVEQRFNEHICRVFEQHSPAISGQEPTNQDV